MLISLSLSPYNPLVTLEFPYFYLGTYSSLFLSCILVFFFMHFYFFLSLILPIYPSFVFPFSLWYSLCSLTISKICPSWNFKEYAMFWRVSNNTGSQKTCLCETKSIKYQKIACGAIANFCQDSCRVSIISRVCH